MACLREIRRFCGGKQNIEADSRAEDGRFRTSDEGWPGIATRTGRPPAGEPVTAIGSIMPQASKKGKEISGGGPHPPL